MKRQNSLAKIADILDNKSINKLAQKGEQLKQRALTQNRSQSSDFFITESGTVD